MWSCSLCAPQAEIAPGATVFTSVRSPYRFRIMRVYVSRVTDAGDFAPVLWPWPTPPTRWRRLRGWACRWLRRALRLPPRGVEVVLRVGDRRAHFDANYFHGHLDLGEVEKGGEIEIELRNQRTRFEVIRLSFGGIDLDEEERRDRLQRKAQDTLDHLRNELGPIWARRERGDDG